jgi:hypothetical protein
MMDYNEILLINPLKIYRSNDWFEINCCRSISQGNWRLGVELGPSRMIQLGQQPTIVIAK